MSTRVIVPAGAGGLLRRWGFNQVDEITQGDRVQIEGTLVEATPANHSGRRYPFGPIVEPLGFLIHGRYKIYFAGDTDIFPEMTAIGTGLDVALLPVWGWGPNLGDGHMDPQDAARVLVLLLASVAIPIHWGTYFPLGLGWLKPTILYLPPEKFARDAAKLAPGVTVKILEPGQSLDLSTID